MMSLVLTKRASLRSWEDTTISFAYMNNSQKDGQALLCLSYLRNLLSQQSQQKVKMKHILLNEDFSLRGSFVNFPLGILWSMVRSVRFSLEHNMVMLVNNSKRCLHSHLNRFSSVWPLDCKLMSLSMTRDWLPSTTDLLLSFSLMWKKLSPSSQSSRQSSIAWPNQDRKAWKNTKRWLNCSKLTKKRTYFSMLRLMQTNRFWISQTMLILWIHSSNCFINKTASRICTYGSRARTMIFKHSRQLSQSGMESIQKSKSSRKRTPTHRKRFRPPSVKKASSNLEYLVVWRRMQLS